MFLFKAELGYARRCSSSELNTVLFLTLRDVDMSAFHQPSQQRLGRKVRVSTEACAMVCKEKEGRVSLPAPSDFTPVYFPRSHVGSACML